MIAALRGAAFGVTLCTGLFAPLGVVPVAVVAGAFLCLSYPLERLTARGRND